MCHIWKAYLQGHCDWLEYEAPDVNGQKISFHSVDMLQAAFLCVELHDASHYGQIYIFYHTLYIREAFH